MTNQPYPIPKSNPNAMMSISFLILWVVNAVVIALVNSVLPNNIVLGTMSLNYTAALLLSSGVLAWFSTLTMPIFTFIEMRKRMVLSPQHWLIGYLVLNVLSIWVAARFSDILGLGISSWLYVVVLAAILDFAQGMAMMAYGEIQKKLQ